MNQALLNSILELNRCSLELTTDQFDQAVFDLVHTLIPFDSAVFGSAAFVGDAVVPVGVSLRNLDQSFLGKLIAYAHLDDTNMAAIAQAGTTLMRCAKDAHPVVKKEVLDHYPVYYSMVTGVSDRRSGVYQGLSINRRETGIPFTEEERELKQAFMPHFQEAYATNRLHRALDVLTETLPSSYCVVSSTVDGTIIATSAAAMEYLANTFPEWRGGVLPAQLLNSLSSLEPLANSKVFSSRDLVVKALKSADRVLWQLREPNNLDSLGARQFEVAQAYASGLSHKEIAKKLNLSPSTISNQLASVYEKLKVDNKAALAQLLKE